MVCLSEKQLAQLALGLTEDADLTAHLKECASCRAAWGVNAVAHASTDGSPCQVR